MSIFDDLVPEGSRPSSTPRQSGKKLFEDLVPQQKVEEPYNPAFDPKTLNEETLGIKKEERPASSFQNPIPGVLNAIDAARKRVSGSILNDEDWNTTREYLKKFPAEELKSVYGTDKIEEIVARQQAQAKKSLALSEAAGEGVLGITPTQPQLKNEFPVATTATQIGAGVLPYLLPGGNIAKFTAIPAIQEIIGQATNPEEKLNPAQRAGRVGISGVMGNITGRIFGSSDLGKTVFSRVLQKSLGAGATSITESIVKDAISGYPPEVQKALINGGINAASIAILSGLTDSQQLRSAVIKEGSRIAGKPVAYEEAVQLVKGRQINPEELSPAFQEAQYQHLKTQAIKQIEKETGRSINDRALKEWLIQKGSEQRASLFDSQAAAEIKHARINGLDPQNGMYARLLPYRQLIINGADPVDLYMAIRLADNLRAQNPVVQTVKTSAPMPETPPSDVKTAATAAAQPQPPQQAQPIPGPGPASAEIPSVGPVVRAAPPGDIIAAPVEGKPVFKNINSMTKEEMLDELNTLDAKNKAEIARLDRLDPNRQKFGTIELTAEEIQRMNELGNAIERIKAQEAAPAVDKIRGRKAAAAAKNKSATDPQKALISSINKKVRRPILSDIRVGGGYGYVTDLETALKVKIDKPDGLYKAVGSNLEPSSNDPQDYPVVQDLKNKIGTFNKTEMIRNFVRASRQVSEDDTREVLKHVLLEIEGGKAYLVSTDGRRLSLSDIEIKGGVDGQYLITHPAKIAKMLTALSGDSLEARVDDKKNRIEFAGENGSVFSMLFEGQFPDYKNVLDVQSEHTITINRNELAKALRELKPYAKDFANEQGRDIIPHVIVEPKGKDVHIYALGSEGKKKEFIFKGAVEHKPQKVRGTGTIVLPMSDMNAPKLHSYNFDYFSDAIDNVTGDKVIISLPKEPKTTHITGEPRAKVDKASSKGYTVKEGESNYYADQIQPDKGKDNSAGKQRSGILQQSPLYTKFKEIGGLVFASEKISSPADIAFAFKNLKNEAVEHFYCIGVKDDAPVCVEFISMGSISSSIVDPFETIRLLLDKKADGVYFVHNHPSGIITPSDEDLSITRRLKEAMKILKVSLKGHVIIDDTSFGFINENGGFEEYRHKETAEEGEKVPLYKKYVEWLKPPEDKILSRRITGPGDVFEVVKGFTVDFEGSDVVLYFDTQLKIVSAEAIPKRSQQIKRIIKTATAVRATRIAIATADKDIPYKETVEDLSPSNIDLLDVVVVNKDGSWTSQRAEEDADLEKDNPGGRIEEEGEEYKVERFASPREGLEAWVEKKYKDQEIKLNGIEMPELVRVAVNLSGNTPVVKKLVSALGYFRPDIAKIALEQKIFKYPKVAAQVLAHEIGHLVDWLPDKTMARGNILGRISSLRGYLKSLLAERPGMEKAVLTEEDKDRMRKEARKILKEEQKLGERDIIEEVVREIPIYEKVSITVDEILSIWRGAATEIRTENPALYDFIAKLSVAEKKAIIQQALKGIIDPRILDISGEGKRVGTRIEKEKVKRHIVPPEPTPENIAKKFKELLLAEIKKRKLFQEEVIREELKRVTQWWNPFDDTRKDWYTRYRYSSEELYAEAVSLLLNRPDKLKEIAPEFYRAFFNYLETKPEVKDLLLGLQDTLAMGEEGKLAERHKDILDMFKRGEDQFFGLREKYKLLRKDPWFLMKYSFIDKNIAVYDKVDQARKEGRNINPDDDPRYFLEEYNYLGGKLKSLMETVKEKVMDPLEKADLTIEDFGQYIFLYRVANERAEIANPLGHNPDTARAQLDFLKNMVGPERFSVLEKAQQDFRSVMLGLLREATDSGILSEAKFIDLEKNPAYATFQVLDYLEDYVTPTIIKQVGTLKPIANPFASTLLKMISTKRAIERNNTNKAVLKFMRENFPNETESAPVRRFGKFRVDVPAKEGMGTIKVRVGGRMVAYYVDPYIADSCNYSPVAVSNGVVEILRFFNSGWFRPVYVNLNVGFQAFNFVRDFTRAWKLNPDVSFIGHMKSYFKAAPHAFNRVWGSKGDQIIKEMEENGMFSFTYNEIMRGANDEDEKMVEYLMRKYQVTDRREDPQGFNKVPYAIKYLMNIIEDIGNFIESLPKVAGYMDRRDRGMNIKEIAHEVRTYTGSPDFLRKGAKYNEYNQVFLFSNAIKEGLRGDFEGGFKNPRTRGGYWWKTAIRDILPKVLQILAIAGFFGKQVKDAYDRMTEYDKTNYTCLPLGITKDDKVIYVRLPSDESGRLVGAMFWKILNFNRLDPVSSSQEILSYAGGQVPGFSPAIEIPVNWLQFITGKVPYDWFKGKPVINEDEMRAGGKYALNPMLKWTAGELGAYSFTIKAGEGETATEKVVRYTPILNRFIRITDYGLKEKQRFDDQDYWKEKVRFKLDKREERQR